MYSVIIAEMLIVDLLFNWN